MFVQNFSAVLFSCHVCVRFPAPSSIVTRLDTSMFKI